MRVRKFWAQTCFTDPSSPSVTDVVQTISWLFHSHDNNESSRLTNKSSLNTMKKQRRGLDGYNVLQDGRRSKDRQTTSLEI